LAILSEREREVVIGADSAAPVGICFMPMTDAKTTKNRLHLDLSPDPGEQEAEIEPSGHSSTRTVPGRPPRRH
jgi:hypothetical protein